MPCPSKKQGSSLEGDADVSITDAMTDASMCLISASGNLCQGFKDPCAMSFCDICADLIQPRSVIKFDTHKPKIDIHRPRLD